MERNLLKRIKASEGWVPRVYTCPAGKLTIGYGFNLEDCDMPKEVADKWLSILVNEVRTALYKSSNSQTFGWLTLSRKEVLIDMAYNLGVNGLMGFKNMWKALEDGDYDRAADEMLDSKWARQVGRRATELAEIMRTG